jgi:hypothetical protein
MEDKMVAFLALGSVLLLFSIARQQTAGSRDIRDFSFPRKNGAYAVAFSLDRQDAAYTVAFSAI